LTHSHTVPVARLLVALVVLFTRFTRLRLVLAVLVYVTLRFTTFTATFAFGLVNGSPDVGAFVGSLRFRYLPLLRFCPFGWQFPVTVPVGLPYVPVFAFTRTRFTFTTVCWFVSSVAFTVRFICWFTG